MGILPPVLRATVGMWDDINVSDCTVSARNRETDWGAGAALLLHSSTRSNCTVPALRGDASASARRLGRDHEEEGHPSIINIISDICHDRRVTDRCLKRGAKGASRTRPAALPVLY